MKRLIVLGVLGLFLQACAGSSGGGYVVGNSMAPVQNSKPATAQSKKSDRKCGEKSGAANCEDEI